MDLVVPKEFIKIDNWNSAALKVLEFEVGNIDQTNFTSEHLTIKTQIFEKLSASEENLKQFLKFINPLPEKLIYFRKLIIIFTRTNKFDAALQVISHTLAKINGGPFFYRQKINLLSKLNKPKEAYDAAIIFCNKFPKRSFGYFKLIQTLLVFKGNKEAFVAYQIHRNKLDNQHKLQILQQLKCFDEVLKVCAQIFEKNANPPFWFYRFKAIAYFNLNNLEKTLAVIETANFVKPNHPFLFSMKVNIHLKKREWEEAKIILTEKIRVQNFNFDDYRRLIICLTQTEKTDELFQLSSLTLKHQKKEQINCLIARRLINLKDYERANLISNQFFLPNSTTARSLKILTQFNQEQFDLVEKNIQLLFQRRDFKFESKENIPIHYTYCRNLVALKKWELAEQQCELYLTKFPKSLQFHNLLLDIYNDTNQSGKYDDFLKDTYTKFEDKKPWLLYRYIRHLQLVNEDDEAIKILKQKPQNTPQVYTLLSKIYLGKGDFSSFMELAASPDLDTGNKIISLEGTIATYLSLGYFQMIPTLIQSILKIETNSSDLIYLKCIALNLGNRLFNLIHSPLIHTNLALPERNKIEIQTDLKNLDFHFNSRLLTYELINTASTNLIDDVKYLLKITSAYFKKLESYNNVWLNTYEDPKHAFKIANALKESIINKTPTSLIRIGDGEGNFLKYPPHLREHQSADQERIQTYWWPDSIITDQKIKDEFCNNLNDAIDNADIIGVFPDRRLYRVLGQVLSVNKTGGANRGGLAIMNSLINNKFSNKTLTSCHCHFDLETWDLYNYILSGLEKVSVITCHQSLKEYITKRFGINEVELIDIPSEKKYAQLFGYKEEADHYPERYNEILQKVANCEKGQVFLVAAGFLGKIYCSKIKAAGGIGIDIGSIADYWLNFKTRGNDKIPPIKNGIRFTHEINNKIELATSGELTKTNHYCNKQITYSANDFEVENFEFLITGHPRSGTKFISKLFQKFGFNIGHELLEKNGVCSWLHAASNLNTPYFGYKNIGKYKPSRYEMNPENILLIIRHPKEIIPSIILENGILLSYNYRRYHIYEASGIDLDHYESTLEKAIVSYMEWIRMIERQNVDGIIRLEYAQEDIIRFFQKKNIGFNSNFDEESIINRNSTKKKFGVQKSVINAADYQAINKDLLAQLIAFCKKYNYDLDFLGN